MWDRHFHRHFQRLRTPPASYADLFREMKKGRGNPVVLVPGYKDNYTVFRQLIRTLKRHHFAVHPLSLRPSDGRAPLEVLAGQVAAYVDHAFAPEQSLDFIGFSMGGLVLRYYLQRMGGLQRVQRLVTLGTPHRGTYMAYYRGYPALRQMRPGSRFVRSLARDEERLASIHFTSIWTPLDLTIVPASSSVLPVGVNAPIMLPYHRALVTSQRALQQTVAALQGPRPSLRASSAG